MKNLVMLAVLLVSACTQPPYSPFAQDQVLNGCQEGGGTPRQCMCALHKLEAQLSERQYMAMELRVRAGLGTATDIKILQTTIFHCATENR
jgi:hypothetical protein